MEDWMTQLLGGVTGSWPATAVADLMPSSQPPAGVPQGPPQLPPEPAPPPPPDPNAPQGPELGLHAQLGELLNPGAVDQPQGPPLSGMGSPTATAKPPALADALRGVTVPKPPEPQRVSTPAAPRPVPLAQDQLIKLLLGMNQAAQARDPGLHLPSTLGQALAGRAYG